MEVIIMILDTMKNKELYYKLGEGFKKGFEFIEKCKVEGIEVGKYEIDGKNVFANVQEYNSKEEAKFESHDNYIDVQYILKGNEMMYWEARDKCEEMIEYNPEKAPTVRRKLLLCSWHCPDRGYWSNAGILICLFKCFADLHGRKGIELAQYLQRKGDRIVAQGIQRQFNSPLVADIDLLCGHFQTQKLFFADAIYKAPPVFATISYLRKLSFGLLLFLPPSCPLFKLRLA
jgi:hypothetical protein